MTDKTWDIAGFLKSVTAALNAAGVDYVSNILNKFEVVDGSEAIVRAHEKGLGAVEDECTALAKKQFLKLSRISWCSREGNYGFIGRGWTKIAQSCRVNGQIRGIYV